MTKRKILYGYQIRGGALEIVPEEQRVVQMLFALYSAGASYNATLWAMSEKVTEGTSATTFSPNDLCTRGQIVTFLYRYMGK